MGSSRATACDSGIQNNSIVVNVLYYIFKRLFVDTEPTVNKQLKLF